MTHWALLLATLLSLPASPHAADVAGLSSADPRERERAARSLAAGAEVGRLDALAEAVAAVAAPRPPGVEGAVRQAVGYAHLKAARRAWLAEYLGPEGEDGFALFVGGPFLGVSSDRSRRGTGALIGGTVIGFPASTALRGGDVIVWLQIDGGESLPTHDFETLTSALALARRGRGVRLTVLRGGRADRVELELAGRVLTDDPAWHLAAAEALRKAGEVWERDFAPLFEAPPTSRPAGDRL